MLGSYLDRLIVCKFQNSRFEFRLRCEFPPSLENASISFLVSLSYPKSYSLSSPFLTCHFYYISLSSFRHSSTFLCSIDLNQIKLCHWCINCSHLYMTNVALRILLPLFVLSTWIKLLFRCILLVYYVVKTSYIFVEFDWCWWIPLDLIDRDWCSLIPLDHIVANYGIWFKLIWNMS